MIPLILKLKKTSHKEIARAQDLAVEVLYRAFNEAVLHGGTSIWRCYKGNRFSEDIDVYLKKDTKKLDTFFRLLEKRGFAIEKRKVGENSLYSTLKLGNTLVRFEAIFKTIQGSLKEYETAEGNLISVYALTPEQLIKEKIAAYVHRLKVRDLYDVFFLLRYVSDRSAIKNEIQELMSKFKKPLDEGDLKILILEGLVPSTDKMMEYIKASI